MSSVLTFLDCLVDDIITYSSEPDLQHFAVRRLVSKESTLQILSTQERKALINIMQKIFGFHLLDEDKWVLEGLYLLCITHSAFENHHDLSIFKSHLRPAYRNADLYELRERIIESSLKTNESRYFLLTLNIYQKSDNFHLGCKQMIFKNDNASDIYEALKHFCSSQYAIQETTSKNVFNTVDGLYEIEPKLPLEISTLKFKVLRDFLPLMTSTALNPISTGELITCE